MGGVTVSTGFGSNLELLVVSALEGALTSVFGTSGLEANRGSGFKAGLDSVRNVDLGSVLMAGFKLDLGCGFVCSVGGSVIRCWERLSSFDLSDAVERMNGGISRYSSIMDE